MTAAQRTRLLLTSLANVAIAATICFAQPAPSPAAPTNPGVSDTVYPTACVAADHRLASEAGLEILKKGGNAVDAAVATSFALSVVRPYSCGLGGGGFMVIHLKKHPKNPALGTVTTSINYREWAIAKAVPDYLEHDPDPDASTHGGKAVCVPGCVAGLLYALDKYGTMDRATVLAPAIRLAEEGFDVDSHYAENMHTDDLVIPWFKADAARQAKYPMMWERFLRQGEVKVGDHILVPEQARAMRLIASQGANAFYKGDIAKAIVASVAKAGGDMTLDDLAGYKVEELEPLRAMFRGKTILTMPPPSSGGLALAQVFAMLQDRGADLNHCVKLAPPEGGHESAPYIHLVTECMKHAFADRARWMGDPNFVNVPTRFLLSPAYTREKAQSILMNGVAPIDSYGTATPPPEDHGTSHLCVVDKDGSAVSCTETVNLIFGSMVTVDEYGFVLNNEMDDFLTRRGHANAFGLDHADLNLPAPEKRPLSCMTPTIVADTNLDGTVGPVRLIAGASGGPRIISGTIEASLNVLAWDMPAGEAVAAPRFHHQWHPNKLDLEPALRTKDLMDTLSDLGHNLGQRNAVGNVQIIRSQPGGWQPACDPRKGGQPAGY